ncbi:MAG: DUF4249 family protein [Cyclobacteriaceae bacterium]|nr:DUF4249 family protein [Cyclobacteriaceae bacterium HetDA_MAG_MS6]
MRNLFIYLLFFAAIVSACDDRIDVALDGSDPILVVDAWITRQAQPQVIKLSLSQAYFDNTNPPTVTGATVTVTDEDGVVFNFPEQDAGNYVWTPQNATDSFGTVGKNYFLSVALADGNQFSSAARLGRSPAVDSVTFRFEEEEEFFPEESYLAELWARDFEGVGDTYWIKAWKNNVYLNRPEEINIAFDAGFSEGAAVDGDIFIRPIREAVNPFDEDEDDEVLRPFEMGDSLYIEIHSLNRESFFYIQQIQVQIDRPGGFGELFSAPLANVGTNIIPSESNPDVEVAGFFNVASVTAGGRTLTEDAVRQEE